MILHFRPGRTLQFSHFSPLNGQPDTPENYHTVTYELSGNGDQTDITLTQDKNTTHEEREHSENNWRMVLVAMKKYLEG